MHNLRLFCDVARCRSFTQAASLHGMTQSAASQRISALEKQLGVTLIDRSVRPLALTQAGQAYLAGCEDMIEQYDELERRVLAMADHDESPVRVAAIYSSGIGLLNQLARRFEAEHPKASVEIHYQRPDEVYTAILEDHADVGICSYPQRWQDIGIIPLREEVMVVVCRPDHALAQASQVEAGDLSPYDMITFDVDLPAGRRIRQYLQNNHATPRITDALDNVDSIKNVVSLTDRFAILPGRTVAREVQAGTLAAVRLTPTLVRPIGIIHRKRRRHGPPLGPAAQSFVDYLLKHAGPSVAQVGLDDTLDSAGHVNNRQQKALTAS